MRMRAARSNKGFTLVETILASVIFCGAVLALGTISTRALSQSKLNRQYETASSLADQQLSLIDYIGVEDFILSGETEGWYEVPDQRYRWQVVTQSLGIDNLYLVNVTVGWVDRSRVHSVSVETRLNGRGVVLELAGL